MANANASNDSTGDTSLVDRITGFISEPFGIALVVGVVLALLAVYWFVL